MLRHIKEGVPVVAAAMIDVMLESKRDGLMRGWK